MRPLIERECIGCHTDEGIAPFALETFEDARAQAAAIRAAVADRTMPPWGVESSGSCNTYARDRWLSEEEIAVFVRWAEAGAPDAEVTGTAKRAPPQAEPPPIADTLFDPVIVDIGTDYVPPAGLEDDYRCFLVDPALAEDRFLTAFEIVPTNARIVHHVILFSIDDDGGETKANDHDARDPGPGYPCFGGSGLSLSESRVLAAWAPGSGVTRYPENSGVRVNHGHRMIVQLHYNTANGRGVDRTAVRLELARGVDRPAEILGVADLGLTLAPGNPALTTEPLSIAPGVGGFIRGVFPHMHRLGRTMNASIGRTSGVKDCLVHVPDWDFDWQQFYFLSRPLYVASTDKVELSCIYDTTSVTEEVRFGEGTSDEMCLLGLYVTLN